MGDERFKDCVGNRLKMSINARLNLSSLGVQSVYLQNTETRSLIT